jgi:MAPEG family
MEVSCRTRSRASSLSSDGRSCSFCHSWQHGQCGDASELPIDLTVKQRGVLKGIIVGAAITLVAIVGAILAGPMMLSPEATAGERIAFALGADAFIALWLGISVGLLARHRFFTPEDIDGGGLTHGTETASILQATLQNTLEQTVLAVLVHLAWAALMPVSWMSAIPAAVVLFLCGRVLFVSGYRGGAPSRAVGFALTYYPSVLMLVFVVGATVWRGFF